MNYTALLSGIAGIGMGVLTGNPAALISGIQTGIGGAMDTTEEDAKKKKQREMLAQSNAALVNPNRELVG